jgi:DNA mismatch repair protein MutL
MTEIHELDDDTVDRIAAGEVVERPASVVKELVENSIDADASRVQVAVAAGGTERIAVSDDGVGMTEDEVRLAVREHTTSKIRDIDDLESGVGTLGFRGEALHAIGAVSRLTVRTRKRGAARGTELRMEGGEVVAVEPAGCPEGTTIVVEDLFFNVPARRKYLKQESTEFSHVNGIVSGYALANPDVSVSLEHDGRETFATDGQGDLRSAVMAVYGREVAANMIPVGADANPGGPLDGVRGLVSHPETTRASREYVTAFVDGRYVTASAVREAVVEAYGRQLAADRYPFAVIFLDVPAGTVDVNVHPRKLEVRFADEDGVRAQVADAVEDALLAEGLLRSAAPRGRSQPEQTAIDPDAGDGSGSDGSGTDGPAVGMDGPGDGTDGPPTEAEVDEHGATAAGTAPRGETDGHGDASTRSEREQADTGTDTPADVAGQTPRTGHDRTGAGGPGAQGGISPPETEGSGGRERAPDDPHGGKFRATPDQATLDGSDQTPEFERLPAMRVLGQVHDTYLVAETDDGVVLVDQHAADERVRYERLREELTDEVVTQALAEPVEVALTPAEAELLRKHGEALARLGFHADLVDDGEPRARVSTVPAMLADAGPELARDLLAAFVEGDPAGTIAERVDDLLGDLACKPAITGNESLTEGTVVDLLEALDDCENPYACPHGRPVLVELAADEIEARFERDYPGHG